MTLDKKLEKYQATLLALKKAQEVQRQQFLELFQGIKAGETTGNKIVDFEIYNHLLVKEGYVQELQEKLEIAKAPYVLLTNSYLGENRTLRIGISLAKVEDGLDVDVFGRKLIFPADYHFTSKGDMFVQGSWKKESGPIEINGLNLVSLIPTPERSETHRYNQEQSTIYVGEEAVDYLTKGELELPF